MTILRVLALMAVTTVAAAPAGTAKKSSKATPKAAAPKGTAPKSASSSGDPLFSARRVAGKTTIECSGALETLMLLAQLATLGPGATEFQEQVRARFAIRANHPAVRETAALLSRGFGWQELAQFSTFLSSAPYFVLNESEELKDLAALLPSENVHFNLDRLHGYAKLVREFYWDNRIGQFLRESLSYYQQAVRRAAPPGATAAGKIFVSPLAPVSRIEFRRRTPHPTTYLVLGD